jgi:hypothetical protein
MQILISQRRSAGKTIKATGADLEKWRQKRGHQNVIRPFWRERGRHRNAMSRSPACFGVDTEKCGVGNKEVEAAEKGIYTRVGGLKHEPLHSEGIQAAP